MLQSQRAIRKYKIFVTIDKNQTRFLCKQAKNFLRLINKKFTINIDKIQLTVIFFNQADFFKDVKTFYFTINILYDFLLKTPNCIQFSKGVLLYSIFALNLFTKLKNKSKLTLFLYELCYDTVIFFYKIPFFVHNLLKFKKRY